MFRIGIMQGRLSRPIGSRIQAFPHETWTQEFPVALSLGLSSIEWILESPLKANPFWSYRGIQSILSISECHNVKVEFVCVDYFMESPWVRMSSLALERNRQVLFHVIERAAQLGALGVEIPCVDASEIRAPHEEDELIAAIEPCLDKAFEKQIQIGLETSLSPVRFKSLLKRVDHPALKANYDTGNSASLGYNPSEEIDAYGAWINNVHIKDRMKNGNTVPLGNGDADIPLVLNKLIQNGYKGGWILQAARGNEEVETVRGYKDQFENWLRDILASNNNES